MQYILVTLALMGFGAQAYSVDLDDTDLSDVQADPRLFFVNFTSSLVQVNSTLLAYGLVGLAIAAAAAVALYYLYIESANSSSGYGQSYGQNYQNYQSYSRSANDGYGMGDMNILKWLAMAQEVYNKFDLTSMDCQKKVVCEIVQQQEVFGSASRSLESSFQFASLLENFNLPDDVRDILDEYMDASEQANGQKNCEEVFDCPFSIADAVKRSFYGNSL